jgi:hypothetical protein
LEFGQFAIKNFWRYAWRAADEGSAATWLCIRRGTAAIEPLARMTCR